MVNMLNIKTSFVMHVIFVSMYSCQHGCTQDFYSFSVVVKTLRMILSPNIRLLIPPSSVNLIFSLQISPNIPFPPQPLSLSHCSRPNLHCVTLHIAPQIEICMVELFPLSLWVFRMCTQDFGKCHSLRTGLFKALASLSFSVMENWAMDFSPVA